jgi:signal transduction histidine kinase
MHENHDSAEILGLHFFGNITASISHELKNALAIINENGGLLGDLALLMEKGRPLDPERLSIVSANIRRQVKRADDIVRRLNRFAHSAHEPATTTNVFEILEFTATLAARLATMKGVTIAVVQEAPIQITIRPFQLENVLWLCLEHLFLLTEGNLSVEFGASTLGDDVLVSMRFGEEQQAAEIETRVAREGGPLLAALQAELCREANLLRLKIPLKADR